MLSIIPAWGSKAPRAEVSMDRNTNLALWVKALSNVIVSRSTAPASPFSPFAKP